MGEHVPLMGKVRDSEMGDEHAPLMPKGAPNPWTWRQALGCIVLLMLICASLIIGGSALLRTMQPVLRPIPVIPEPIRLQAQDEKQLVMVMKKVYGEHYNAVRSHARGLSAKEKEEWAKKPVNHGDKSGGGATYGELDSQGFSKLLQAPNVSAKANENFYDLGSGDGKLVMMAWMMGLKATGIELVDKRFEEACRALGDVRNLQRPSTASSMMRFFRGSFTELRFDDADIIFMDNVLWKNDVMQLLATAAKQLKKGTRIILSHPIETKDFVTLEEVIVPASWCQTCTWIIQIKVTESIVLANRPLDLPGSHGSAPAGDHCEV